jgi:hypothetical protein
LPVISERIPWLRTVLPHFSFLQVLADMFSFDIRQFWDEEEEDTSSKALAPLADDVKRTLMEISNRLENSLDVLVVDCGSIRAWFHEIQNMIPEDLATTLTLAFYLEQHQFKLEKARQRIANRRERKDLEATIQVNRQSVNEEKASLDQLSFGPCRDPNYDPSVCNVLVPDQR